MSNKKPKPWTKAVEDKFLSKMCVLVVAWLMEQPEFKDDPARLGDFVASMFRWWSAIKGNELSIMKARRIVEQKIGIKVYF